MSMLRCAVACLAVGILALTARAEDPKPKRLLLVTDSGGFIHDSVGFAEKTLKELGPKYGFEVECFRFTRDPENTKVFNEYAERFRKTTGVPVEKENCGRVNADT